MIWYEIVYDLKEKTEDGTWALVIVEPLAPTEALSIRQ